MSRYFNVKILPVAFKCRFCPIPKALRPWEPCPCPYFNTKWVLFDSRLKRDRLQQDLLNNKNIA